MVTDPDAVIAELRAADLDEVTVGIAEVVVETLQVAAEADLWDCPAVMYVVVLDAPLLEVRFLGELPPFLDVVHALEIMADAVPSGEFLFEALGEDVIGWLLVYEGWRLTDPTPEEREGLHGPISQHPRRQEIRFAFAVDRTRGYMASQARGEGIELMVDRPPEITSGGRVPDVLHRIMAATPIR